MNRRDFIKTAAVAAVGMPTIVPASVLGTNGRVAPSNRIVMAGIGLGRRGRMVLRQGFLTQPDVHFVAIADVQEEQREIIRRIVNREYGNEDCVKVRDMYEVLGRDDIDAVLITTGNRWHALASILATRAGKDVYCEKPSSMSVQESLDLARQVKASGQVFQAGMQRRNVENFQFAVQLAHSGRLGQLKAVHAGILQCQHDAPAHPEQPEPDPDVCDWDRWLGPASWRPYNQGYLVAWKRHFDLVGGAGLPEWGSHTVDLCQWAAQADQTAPLRYDVEGETITGHYESGVKLVMRKAGFKGDGDWQVQGTCPVRFEGDEGWVEADDRGELLASDASLLEDKPAASAPGMDPTRHIRDFLDCTKSREQPAVNADVTCQSHIACHAAAIGWQLGRTVHFDPSANTFLDDDEANHMRVWPYRKGWGQS